MIAHSSTVKQKCRRKMRKYTPFINKVDQKVNFSFSLRFL